MVRLLGSEETIVERVGRREIGAGGEEQLTRSLRQARVINDEAGGEIIRMQTDGRPPAEIADDLLHRIGWLG